MDQRNDMGRVLGLWLLYAVVGLFMVAIAVGGGDLSGVEEKRSPTRFVTKLVGAASGCLLLAGAAGWYVTLDATGSPDAMRLLLMFGGWLLGAAATIACWLMIRRDLRRRRRR
jgi:hypothetical protein